MADGNVTPTTAANFIPEMWRDAILDYAERRFVLRNQVSDFSSMLASGGDILNIPKVAEETAASKTAGSAVTYTNNTDGVVQLAVDQHHYEAKRIDDIVRVQESADLFNAYARSMGYALAKKVENYLALEIQKGTGNDIQLGTDDVMTAALVRDGLEKLLDAGYDYGDGNTFMYANPKAYMSLLGIGDFTSANLRGDAENPNVTGKIINAYGMELYPSTDWAEGGTATTEAASIFRRESVYFAQQVAPRVQSSYDIDHLATSVVADVLFGAALSHAVSSTSLGIVNFNNVS
ncbi:MAG: putative minor capsid protein 10B [Prokaryotic dsDNA virus sp.]|nr:MAG: putative minor capsid protein 10B [Prokaryotic dsDNA virus sp.]|tara:strand:- start:1690 stop:2562 length:873 start_codon:yes stop_codon:yes gene_type:complete